MARLKSIKEEKKKKTKKTKNKKKDQAKLTAKEKLMIAQLKPEWVHKSSTGKMSDPVKALVDKLKKDGADSLNSSGINVKW